MPRKASAPTHSKRERRPDNERRQYRNPPIIEATCEFIFAQDSEWNLVFAGRFLERVKEQYPGKPQEQQVLQNVGLVLEGGDGAMPFRRSIRVQIPTENGQQSVAIGAGRLSVHVRTPYSGWESYRKQIEEAFNTYVDLAAPKGVARIGIRYVNVIRPAEDEIAPHRFLTSPAPKLGNLSAKLVMFAERHEYEYEDRPIKALVTTAKAADKDSGKPGYILDIDLIQEWHDQPIPTRDAMSVVDELRARERQVFEALITDKSRELFDA